MEGGGAGAGILTARAVVREPTRGIRQRQLPDMRLPLGRNREAGVRFDVVVSVGDAPWDVRTAYNLGLRFVGVGSGEKGERLRAAGALVVLDHLDYGPLLRALRRARVPVPALDVPAT
jgi:phosphoglycolate phosphatase-like HAD superfamily hydrolase